MLLISWKILLWPIVSYRLKKSQNVMMSLKPQNIKYNQSISSLEKYKPSLVIVLIYLSFCCESRNHHKNKKILRIGKNDRSAFSSRKWTHHNWLLRLEIIERIKLKKRSIKSRRTRWIINLQENGPQDVENCLSLGGRLERKWRQLEKRLRWRGWLIIRVGIIGKRGGNFQVWSGMWLKHL